MADPTLLDDALRDALDIPDHAVSATSTGTARGFQSLRDTLWDRSRTAEPEVETKTIADLALELLVRVQKANDDYVQIGWLTASNFFLSLKDGEDPRPGWEAVYAHRGAS